MRKIVSPVPTLLFVLLSIISLSCQKEVEPGQNDNDPPPQKVQLLTREVSYTSGNPTLKQVRMFEYDISDRCIKVVIGSIDSSGTVQPSLNISRTLTFDYNGADTLPYKVADVRSIFPNLTTNYYFKYDNKGMKIQDSVRVLNQAGEPADKIVDYQYNNSYITAFPRVTGFPIDNNPFDTLFISQSRITKKSVRTPTPGGDQLHTVDFEYDDKVNPYSKLSIWNALYFTNSSIGIGYNVPTETHYRGYGKNNITIAITNGAFRSIFNYEYDSFNYPVKREQYYESQPATKTFAYFEYKEKK